MITLYGGGGFIGKAWSDRTKFQFRGVQRHETKPHSPEALFLISTTDNYSVFDKPTLDIETNLMALMQRLSEFRAGDTFNYVSSWFVYGDHKEAEVNEDDFCDPRGFYSITKRCAEQLLISYCTTHKINWRIFRLSNIYGPGEAATQKKNALTYLIGELKLNKPIALYWGGNCYRDYLHVRDCCRAIDYCLKKAPLNSITNIGYGRSRNFGDLIREAARLLESKSVIKDCEPPPFHKQVQARNFYMDVSKLTSYGFIPDTSMQEGLEELCGLT